MSLYKHANGSSNSFTLVNKEKQHERLSVWNSLFQKYSIVSDDPGVLISDLISPKNNANKNSKPKVTYKTQQYKSAVNSNTKKGKKKPVPLKVASKPQKKSCRVVKEDKRNTGNENTESIQNPKKPRRRLYNLEQELSPTCGILAENKDFQTRDIVILSQKNNANKDSKPKLTYKTQQYKSAANSNTKKIKKKPLPRKVESKPQEKNCKVVEEDKRNTGKENTENIAQNPKKPRRLYNLEQELNPTCGILAENRDFQTRDGGNLSPKNNANKDSKSKVTYKTQQYKSAVNSNTKKSKKKPLPRKVASKPQKKTCRVVKEDKRNTGKENTKSIAQNPKKPRRHLNNLKQESTCGILAENKNFQTRDGGSANIEEKGDVSPPRKIKKIASNDRIVNTYLVYNIFGKDFFNLDVGNNKTSRSRHIYPNVYGAEVQRRGVSHLRDHKMELRSSDPCSSNSHSLRKRGQSRATPNHSRIKLEASARSKSQNIYPNVYGAAILQNRDLQVTEYKMKLRSSDSGSSISPSPKREAKPRAIQNVCDAVVLQGRGESHLKEEKFHKMQLRSSDSCSSNSPTPKRRGKIRTRASSSKTKQETSEMNESRSSYSILDCSVVLERVDGFLLQEVKLSDSDSHSLCDSLPERGQPRKTDYEASEKIIYNKPKRKSRTWNKCKSCIGCSFDSTPKSPSYPNCNEIKSESLDEATDGQISLADSKAEAYIKSENENASPVKEKSNESSDCTNLRRSMRVGLRSSLKLDSANEDVPNSKVERQVEGAGSSTKRSVLRQVKRELSVKSEPTEDELQTETKQQCGPRIVATNTEVEEKKIKLESLKAKSKGSKKQQSLKFNEGTQKQLARSFDHPSSSSGKANTRQSLQNRGQESIGDVNLIDTKVLIEETLKSDLAMKVFKRYCCQKQLGCDQRDFDFWHNAVKVEVQRLSQIISLEKLSDYMRAALAEWLLRCNIQKYMMS